jgi:hypothetical protein
MAFTPMRLRSPPSTMKRTSKNQMLNRTSRLAKYEKQMTTVLRKKNRGGKSFE